MTSVTKDLKHAEIGRLREIYLNLTGRILPQLAEEGGWVIVRDHCFQRVVLDNVFEDTWYNHLDKDGDNPAYKQLSKSELISAIRISKKMERNGGKFVEKLNEKSLEYRDKN